MRFGVVASVGLHLAAIGLAFVSLPDAFRTRVEPEPYVPIEIISQAELALKTSVPAMTKRPKPEEKPEPPKPKPEEKIEDPKPKPPEEKPKPKPEEKKPDPLPKPEVKKPEPDKPKPKPKPEKKEPEELDFDRLSALVDKEKSKEEPEDPIESILQGDHDQKQVGAGDKLSASDTAKMQAAIARCWNASALVGAPEPEKLRVEVVFELNRDGSLRSQPRVANALQINLSGNQFWKVAEQVAVRAVVSCAPYGFLAPDRYEAWKEMQLNFDPSVMAGV